MDPHISAQCLVRQRLHDHASDYGGSGVEATLAGGMCKAGLLCLLTSLSWCRGRFPWSCSGNHRHSPVAVHGQGARCFLCWSSSRVQTWRRQPSSHCCCFKPDLQYIDKVVDVPVVVRMPVVVQQQVP